MGATGQVGGALVPLLTKDAGVEVVAAAREPSKAEKLGVPIVYLDLDKIETFALGLSKV
jgi:NAD(P)H dehydrogenase (quinone)